MNNSISWHQISSVRQLEAHVEAAAQSLSGAKQIQDYFRKSGLDVSNPIALSVYSMSAYGADEPGFVISGTRRAAEIEGPLGRWWRRIFAHSLSVSITFTKSGRTVHVQALYNYE